MKKSTVTALRAVSSGEISVPFKPKVKALPSDMGPIEQLKLSCKPANRAALVVGLLLGGLVPLVSFVLAHYEVDGNVVVYLQLPAYLVLGGLLYSAKSVYEWGCKAFASSLKSFGFLVLLEGTMILSHTSWLGYAALAYLVSINAVSTGVNLALGKKSI